jgi:hypothetical protein
MVQELLHFPAVTIAIPLQENPFAALAGEIWSRRDPMELLFFIL